MAIFEPRNKTKEMIVSTETNHHNHHITDDYLNKLFRIITTAQNICFVVDYDYVHNLFSKCNDYFGFLTLSDHHTMTKYCCNLFS